MKFLASEIFVVYGIHLYFFFFVCLIIDLVLWHLPGDHVIPLHPWVSNKFYYSENTNLCNKRWSVINFMNYPYSWAHLGRNIGRVPVRQNNNISRHNWLYICFHIPMFCPIKTKAWWEGIVWAGFTTTAKYWYRLAEHGWCTVCNDHVKTFVPFPH